MSTKFGDSLKLTIFGQSHGPCIGMRLEGIPAGLSVNYPMLQSFMERRAPGRNEYSSQRNEPDIPQFLTGLTNGTTNGETIEAIIENSNVRSADYSQLRTCPRPGHADFTAYIQSSNDNWASGGGQFSGRMTAPLCIAGGLCLQWLNQMGIRIGAHIQQIGNIYDSTFDPMNPEVHLVNDDFPVLNSRKGVAMREAVVSAKNDGDSLGGVVECAVIGLPAGLGGPLFDGLEGKIAQIGYAIPAVKGIEFGNGFQASQMRGSEHNDCFAVSNGNVITQTNHCGGILGGISNGMPLIFRVAFKPTPSIRLPQQTVDLQTMTEKILTIHGRHDPCIVPRAVPVVEAAAALAIYDAYLSREAKK